MKPLITLIALTLTGCASLTADAPYKAANQARYKYTSPIILGHASTQPTNVAQQDRDVEASWKAEVAAQQANK